jgi:hypothetical protein
MFRSRISAIPSLVKAPCLKFPFRMPLGAPLPRPPCILHTRFPRTAGALQSSCERFDLAPQRGASFRRETSNRDGCMGLIRKYMGPRGLDPRCVLDWGHQHGMVRPCSSPASERSWQGGALIVNQIRAFLLERGVAVRQGLRLLRGGLPGILARKLRAM